MDVYDCKVLSKLDASSEEGFITTVEKDGVIRGPFKTVREAVECARDWDKTPTTQTPPPKPPVKTIDPTPDKPAEKTTDDKTST